MTDPVEKDVPALPEHVGVVIVNTLALRAFTADQMRSWRADGFAAGYRAAIPPGWRLVPEEPTSEMRWAGGDAQSQSIGSYGEPAVVYRAMLSASPKPERLREVARDAADAATNLQREVLQAQADARRYRWLREHGDASENIVFSFNDGIRSFGLGGKRADDIIDAAIAQEPKA